MESILDSIDAAGWGTLVHAAAITQLVGYLLTSQLWLRGMLLLGTFLYIAYYYLYPQSPLWDAIFWAGVLALANLVTLAILIRDRTTFAMSAEEERLYRSFHGIGPGSFRRLMKVAEFRTAPEEALLTREGVVPDHMYFVVEGGIEIDKGGRRLTEKEGTFIGELSLVTGSVAAATVRLSPGTRYVAWNRDKLGRVMGKSPQLKLAVDALIARDMAAKVQRA